ncbi:MAG TPA: putative toxin-antitoxin system toxin component, PIN family [Candidatus Acidoferrales bacterium]|nr:putative toxin-antitoxin system toxin component, PIN family [Candidatus Acidoferrales bacterium]
MISLRLVVDTNIIVSAALKPDGLQRSVLLIALRKPARLYVSDAILDEYRAVLARPRLHIRRGLRQQLLRIIENDAHRIVPPVRLRVAADPGDDMFLECADAAKADYVVTGNISHFPRYWKKTKIITSREFLDIVAPHLLS